MNFPNSIFPEDERKETQGTSTESAPSIDPRTIPTGATVQETTTRKVYAQDPQTKARAESHETTTTKVYTRQETQSEPLPDRRFDHPVKPVKTEKSETYIRDRHTGHGALWAAIIVLAVVGGVAAGIDYTHLHDQNVKISQLFSGQGVVTSLSQRMDAAEAKLQSINWDDMTTRMTALESKVNGQLHESRAYAKKLNDSLRQELSAEMDAQSSQMNARLDQVETQQKSQQTEMAQMQGQLQGQIASVSDGTNKRIDGLNQQLVANAQNVDSLSSQVDRDQLNFEASKGNQTELAPGVLLTLQGTNVSHQQYKGYVFLMQDHKFVWMKNLSVNKSVRLFPTTGGQPDELVVTDVGKDYVIGYMLVPHDQNATAAQNAPASTTPSTSASSD